MTDIQIKIDGVGYLDFTDVSVSMGMEQFARTFRATFSDKFVNSALLPLPFAEGSEVTITVDGEQVLDGYIDDVPISYDAKSHTISVTGRSWTGHLVDSSAIYKAGVWKDTDLLTIARNICEPFGITAKFDDATVLPTDLARTEKFRKFAIESQESAYDCIARAAKLRGVFLVSNQLRELVLTKAATSAAATGAALVYGQNILRGTRSGRFQERFSDYIVKSQNAGSDDFFGAATKGVFRVSDPQVTAYRPLVIVSDGQGRANELEVRANWERNVRAGRSRRVSYQVRGAHIFANDAGPLWSPNTRVVVNDPLLDIADALLLVSVTLQFSGSGTVSSLELGRPEAFTPETPPNARVTVPGGWAGW